MFLASALDLNLKYLNPFILLWLVTPWFIKLLNIVIKRCDWFLKFMGKVRTPEFSHKTPWLIFKIPKYSHKMLQLVFKIECCDWFLKFLNKVIKRCDWSFLYGDVRFIVRNHSPSLWIQSLWINTLFPIYSETASEDFNIILTLFLLTLSKSVLIKFQNDHINSIV